MISKFRMFYFVSLIILLVVPSIGYGAVLFNDDFESGSLSKWSTATSGISISSRSPQSGHYCAKIDYGVSSLQGLIAALSSPPKQDFYVSFYIKIESTYNAPYLGFKWMRLKHGHTDGIQTEFFLNSESWISTGHSYQSGQGGLDTPYTGQSWYPSIKDSNWHRVEVYGKYNTSGQANGVCRIKIDGNIVLNDSAYVWRTGSFSNDVFSRFYIPSNAGDGVHRPKSGDIVYVDNVEIGSGSLSSGGAIPDGGGAVDNNPTISISFPTQANSYNTNSDMLTIEGTASDDQGLASLSWTNGNQQGSISNNLTNWNISNIQLQEGTNQVTVTVTDTKGQTASDTLIVTYNSNVVTSDPNAAQELWAASTQTGDPNWTDSTAVWCVRVLVEGSNITGSGEAIRIGFMGRSSSDYRIRKVSIAEVDPNGGQGAVIDSTWTKIVFDNNLEQNWGNDITTIPAGTEKFSAPVNFYIDPSHNYYVTYAMESPTTYITAPSDYQELYFSGECHADEIDWANNGFSTYNARMHAISSIVVALESPTGLRVISTASP